MNLLQKYYFIPLDIFQKNIHNRGISTKLDTWLVFLTSDEPERIAELIAAYPEFKRLYEEIYELCRNVEDKIDFRKNQQNQRKKGYVVARCEKMRIFEWYGDFLRNGLIFPTLCGDVGKIRFGSFLRK